MNKYNLKNTPVFLQDNLDDDKNSNDFRWYSLALDFIESKIFVIFVTLNKFKITFDKASLKL